ncbi:MAG: 50S ribosomal protein L25/general stress protein Ctc [Halothiobacillaceae bacterium]|nr:MAG: 50S ribosomal protein L25/general stress protein Ctc [Halothiobacillaceae bacterium]
MSVSFTVKATRRDDLGKGASRRLRHKGLVPAVIYGGNAEPASLTIVHKDLWHSLENEAFYSHILDIEIDGKAEKAILRDLQRHPYKPVVLHADFQRVSASDMLHVKVPLHFVNEATSVGVKKGGAVNHLATEIEVTCLPGNLPEFIEVDLASLDVEQTLHLSDLTLPTGVKALELDAHGNDLGVAVIHMPKGAAAESTGA